MTNYSLHGLVDIQIDDPPKIFHRWNMFKTSQSIEPDIIISNFKDNPGDVSVIDKDSVYVNQWHKISHWKIAISGLASGNFPFVIRFKGDPFFSSELFMQLIIEPLLTYTLPLKNALSVHASSVAYKDMGIVFTSQTGVGKTSIMLNLLKQKDFTYFSDDQTLIKNGLLYPYPLEIGVRRHHIKNIGLKTNLTHRIKTFYHQIFNRLLNYYPNFTERIPIDELDFGYGYKKYTMPDPVKLKHIFVVVQGDKLGVSDLNPTLAYEYILKQNHSNEDKLKILTSYFKLYNQYNNYKLDFWGNYNKQVLELCQNQDVLVHKLTVEKKQVFSDNVVEKVLEVIENDV